jgi:anti-sigma regulatory factor (Ser/Thr protein kinase)
MRAPIGPSAAGAHGVRALPGLNAADAAQPSSNPSPRAGGLAVLGQPLVTPLVLTETERRLTFRSLPQAVGAARRVLRDWERHFDPDLFYDLSLCVSELVTSRIQYAQSAAGDEIELAVWRSRTLMRAQIREQEPGATVGRPEAMASTDWGMFIIDRVADRWGVDRGQGALVWCEIDLASDGRSRKTPAGGWPDDAHSAVGYG